MKRIILALTICLSIGTIFTLNSCKKAAPAAKDDSTSAEDANNVSNALNSTNDDATNAAGTNASISGKTAGFEVLCGVLVTVDSVNGVLTLTYSGNDCNSVVKRQGTVTVTLLGYAIGARWKSAGATMQIVYNNLVITNVATGASFTLSGTHYLTNVNGGFAYKVLDGTATGPVIHKHVSDNFTVTFANGTQKTWSVRRTRTFDGTAGLGVKTITLAGDTTVNGDNHVEIWGTNRNGDVFESALIRPIISNSTCGYYHPVSGEYTHFVANRSIDILFGVDANGNIITNGACPYGYNITYTVNSVTKFKTDSYWF